MQEFLTMYIKQLPGIIFHLCYYCKAIRVSENGEDEIWTLLADFSPRQNTHKKRLADVTATCENTGND